MHPAKHLKGVVTTRRDLPGGLWIVRVRPEEQMSFSPGQYVTAGLFREGNVVERPYSVVSSPRERELEFFLEVVPGGKLTPQLYDVPVGGEVYLRPAAKGRFTFDEQSGHVNHFMVATVTGVAPYVSMVRDFLAREAEGESMARRLVILHSASLSSELGYYDELTKYSRRVSWMEYIPTVSRPWLNPDWRGERGRAEDVLRKYLDAVGFDSANTTVYACGNPQMVRQVEGVLERAGYPKEHVKKELYWPPDRVA